MSEVSSTQASTGETGTRGRILDAAEDLFAAQGFAGVSVRMISGAVGLNQASIYNHFPSKQALYEAVLDRGLTPLREILANAAATLDSPEAGDQLLEALSEHLWQSPNLPKLIQREILDNGEYLESLSSQWLRPIYEQGLQAMEKSPWAAGWSGEDDALVVLLMYHLIFGYFFSAPLTRAVLGAEPMSPEMHARQLDFLKTAARRLMITGG